MTPTNQTQAGASILQEKDAESKSMCLSDVKEKIDKWMDSHTEEEVYELLKKYGAVEDADTVIQGWVGRDKDGAVYVHKTKPYRGAGNHGKPEFWVAEAIVELPQNSFPDLTWESDPQPVEITIKRKKNG